ncbi:MAG: hypothetical protein C5B60_04555 [Chloroflexi bacterium]|nr:MAG: hypothetical protein C5B60_04555 [Chloroflexota bacterium]
MKFAHLRQLTATLVILAIISAVGLYFILPVGNRSNKARAEWAALHQHCTTVPAGPMNGVAVHTPISKNVQEVAKAAGVNFKLVEFYDAFGISPFQRKEADEAASLKAIPVIQLNPRRIRLARIAAGKYDHYLQKYAAAVRRFHCQVILSFGHEMNGSWYPWGCPNANRADFIAAWRRIVTVMRPARNITWMWTVNTEPGASCPLISRWPGSRYVSWIGVDGYLRKPNSTFRQRFQRTLAALHQLAPDKCCLISEVGALAGPRQGQRILNIYQGAARNHVLGVIYFDSATGKFGDYRPQDNTEALTYFQKGLRYFLANADLQSVIGEAEHLAAPRTR